MKNYYVDANKIEEETNWQLQKPYKHEYAVLNDELYLNPLSKNEDGSYPVELGQFHDSWLGGKEFVNLDGYRSDNFQLNNKNDIVFIGCSETYGVGIKSADMWAKKVHDKVDASLPFYNLGLIACSSEEIIYNLFKYLKKYGNPGTIFFLMPETFRGFEPTLELSNFRVVQFYHMLEIYCQMNDIQLISSSWEVEPVKGSESSINDLFEGLFDTFYKLDKETYSNLINDFIEQNPKVENAFMSKDKMHMGVALHDAIANFMFLKYKNLTSGI